jgi:hypothetical protein
MIYIYKVKVLASLRNRALASYNEYDMLHFLMNPPSNRQSGINGMFYFYIHEIYDPLFLWNITELAELRIELGNNRFVGRTIRAQQMQTEIWLPTILVSPEPWDCVLADIRVESLDKTVDIAFPSADRFNNNTGSIIAQGKFFKDVIRPYLKFPKIFDTVFGLRDETTYKKYAEDNLSHSYILKNKNIILTVLGNKNNPIAKEYDINDYGGVMDTVTAIFIDAEKEIK